MKKKEHFKPDAEEKRALAVAIETITYWNERSDVMSAYCNVA